MATFAHADIWIPYAVDELQKANAQLTAAMDKLKTADEAGNKAHARDEKKIVKKLEDKCKELEKADKMNQELRAQCMVIRKTFSRGDDVRTIRCPDAVSSCCKN
jgi:hypothetical protein